MKYLLVLISFLLVCPALAGTASLIETTAYLASANGVVVNTNHEWNVGGCYEGVFTLNNIQGGGAHSSVTTGRGNTTYSKYTKINATEINEFESKSDLEFDGGGIYSDTVGAYDYKVFVPSGSSSMAMADTSDTSFANTAVAINQTEVKGQLPSAQKIHTGASGMGDMAHVTADELVLGIDLASDYRVEGGSGIYTVEVDADAAAGASTEEPTMDYRAKVRERYTTSGDWRTGFSGSVSTYYRDFSRPLGFGDEAEVEPVVNISTIEFSEPVKSD